MENTISEKARVALGVVRAIGLEEAQANWRIALNFGISFGFYTPGDIDAANFAFALRTASNSLNVISVLGLERAMDRCGTYISLGLENGLFDQDAVEIANRRFENTEVYSK